MDQHLFAEFREIKMVPKSLRRSLAVYTPVSALSRIPSSYVLGVGHVSFFYDKGAYLAERYEELKMELLRREYNINIDSPLDPDGMFKDERFNKDYTPTPGALALIRQRIAEKIALRPGWYRYEGKVIK
jgi:deoxyribonuclease (pyrimidine dimer)